MITGFDAQDEMQVVALEFLNMGGIGTQGIFSDDKGHVRMRGAQLSQKTVQGRSSRHRLS
ncbi:MAG: hypothetical protein B6I34_07870 [Anaerolineaceae bacterium 4572_32.1]|nr:MAG: hypothetical protein B6I34_07870 [Anaerolineaceae bacterium 4572_32.1]